MIGTTGAILASAAIGAGASIFGASQQSSSADRATQAQTQAQRENIIQQREIFNEQKAALQPWQDVGLDALKRIQEGVQTGAFDLSKYGYQNLIQDPGYKFRLQEGTNALEGAAAARGKFISGDQLRDITAYGQNMASQEFGAAYGRSANERDTNYNILAGLADRGYGAATALSGVTGQFGDRLSTANTNIGNAQAAGATAQGNIWAGLGTNLAGVANQGIGNYLLYNRLQQLGVQ